MNDAMAYYKDAKFDPKKKLRVISNEQPAADTGGVTRQFFNQLLHLLSVEFFHRDDYKIPIYNSHVVASGMMMLEGKIIVQSILQEGPGLLIFSPSVYHYLATRDVDGAIQKMTMTAPEGSSPISTSLVHLRFYYWVRLLLLTKP